MDECRAARLYYCGSTTDLRIVIKPESLSGCFRNGCPDVPRFCTPSNSYLAGGTKRREKGRKATKINEYSLLLITFYLWPPEPVKCTYFKNKNGCTAAKRGAKNERRNRTACCIKVLGF